MNEILVSVLNAVLLAALPTLTVTALAFMYALAAKEWLKFRAEKPKAADLLERYARIAVEAAEQAGIAKIVASKKDYAIEITCKWLDSVGLGGIDVDLIEAEIERQVGKMNHDTRG